MVIDEDNDQPVAQRAFFALAELQRSLGDSLAAQQLYRQVLDEYPDSDFAEEVRERLGLPAVEEVVSDSLTLAQLAYEDAYNKWQSGELEQALDDMFDIGLYFEKTDVAPQAFLAAGSIYTELAVRDSLDIFGVIPVEAPDSLLIARGLVEAIEIAPPVDSLALAADSLAMMSDSLAVPADSLRLATDSLTVGSDSLAIAASDSVEVAGDSLTVAVTTEEPEEEEPENPATSRSADEPNNAPSEGDKVVTATPPEEELPEELSAPVAPIDSLVAVSDSLNVLPDSLQVNPDEVQLASVEAGPLLLEALYGNISRAYQQTPYAEQATVMLNALEGYRADMEALADSLGRMALADSLGVSYDSLDVTLAALESEAATASDSLQTEVSPDAGDTPPTDIVAEGADEELERPSPTLTPATEDEEESENEEERPAAVATREAFDDGPDDGGDEAVLSVEVKPELVGTLEQLMALVKYPEAARADSIEGDLVVDFTVNPQGNAVFPIVKEDPGGGLQEEALRLLKLARFKAGTVRGNPVGMRMTLTLPFRVPPPEAEDEGDQ